MKIIMYTQRVEVIDSYGEIRDCSDQKIADFLFSCGYLPLPIPNRPPIVKEILSQIKPDGILFTGGNSLVKYGGNAPDRDQTEKILLEIALQKRIPLFGFCRGMQFILDYFGNTLKQIVGHVSCRHKITGNVIRESVNSFHTQGVNSVNPPLLVLARSVDNVIEAIQHKEHKVAAIMWHPERETKFLHEDMAMIQDFFG